MIMGSLDLKVVLLVGIMLLGLLQKTVSQESSYSKLTYRLDGWPE